MAGLLITVAVIAACRSGTGPPPGPPDPTFTGEWAGEEWEGEATARLVSGNESDTLYVFGNRPPGLYFETIRVRVPFTGPGEYVLSAEAVEFKVLTGGDVLTASYGGTEPTAGVLEILEHDAASGIVEGTLRFEAQHTAHYAPYGESASFENGWFRAKLRPE